MSNYCIYHLHSDLSNGVTNIDSVTKYGQYIERARECGMTAMGFSEHGSVYEWYHKKCDIESAGMKYLHAVECYITATVSEKVRDNMHCVLVARNYDGVLEINDLVTNSFNRNDNHFYYVPRILIDDIENTSANVIITTACVGGVLGKGDEETKERFTEFLKRNKERCFLEIGHHNTEKQREYNLMLADIHSSTGLRLIAGTDTHALNETHERGRTILQQSKNITFDGEEGWDLKFKTYDELVEAYKRQGVLPEALYVEAIENTNVLADMVSEFSLDKGTKYPHIYKDPVETFRNATYDAMSKNEYAGRLHSEEELRNTVDNELAVYEKTGSIDFMLLQTYIRNWEKENGIYCGPGRGSVSGSMVAYLLGITQMDSMRFGLNYFRFMNPSRVTNADIDTDYAGKDRDAVKQFLLRDHLNLPNINTAEIITFNTIALKGAIRDVCRALYKDSKVKNYLELADKICKEADSDEDAARKKYPDVFEYVDIVNGTIVSVGTHPSGVLVSDLPINRIVGLCSLASSDYPVSMLNMKELDALMFVKMDILGLDNVGCINEACELAGIERLTPDNTDLEDEEVWKSIRDDTTMIFQWESGSAQQYIKRFLSDTTVAKARERDKNFSYLKWVSFGNGLLRPACASFRDSVANGDSYDNGFDELNEFLAPEAGRIAMQETIMQFLVRFCGYSDAESDTVRRGVAKKYGTEKLLPEIERRFIEYAPLHYNITKEKCEEVIKPFLRIILEASSYAFSWNHAFPYTVIGYISGWLRYYYPLEFLTASLNTFADNEEKTRSITEYAARHKIKIVNPKFGTSRGKYFFDKEKNIIAKGIGSIKYMSDAVGEELYALSKEKQYDTFIDLLYDITHRTSLDSRQLDILVKIDYFSDFGNQRELMTIVDFFARLLKNGDAQQIDRETVDGTSLESAFVPYCDGMTKAGKPAKRYKILEMVSVMHAIEKAVKDVGMVDLTVGTKFRNFMELMGYAGYVTGLEGDRATLYIHEIYPLKRKKDGAQFGYSFVTKSVGSGKEARFTVFNNIYKKFPVKKGDFIRCRGYEKEGQYYKMTSYTPVLL